MPDKPLVPCAAARKSWPDVLSVYIDYLEDVADQRDEALNQLDSAKHSIDVLERRIKELIQVYPL